MKGFDLFRQAITWIIEFFLAAGIIAAIITLSGCATLGEPSEVPQQVLIVQETVNHKDLLFTGLMCGAVLGIIGVGMGFGKLGLSISGACVAGILFRTTLITFVSNTWFAIAVGCVILAGCFLVIAAILWKNKALRELIMGIQAARNFGNKEAVTKVVSDCQSKETKAVVANTKHKMKMKGEL